MRSLYLEAVAVVIGCLCLCALAVFGLGELIHHTGNNPFEIVREQP